MNGNELYNISKLVGHNLSNAHREMYSSNLIFHNKTLGKQQTKPTASRRKEIINIRVKINEMKDRKTTEKTDSTKSWFSEKINGIDRKREMTQITRIRNEREGITTDITEIKRVINKTIC